MSEHNWQDREVVITGTAVECPFVLCIYNHAKEKKNRKTGYCTRRTIKLFVVEKEDGDYLDCRNYDDGYIDYGD